MGLRRRIAILVTVAWLSLALSALAQEYVKPENPQMPDLTQGLPEADKEASQTVDQNWRNYVGRIPGCYGMGYGHDKNGKPEIRFQVQNPNQVRDQFPPTLNGFPVIIEEIHEQPHFD